MSSETKHEALTLLGDTGHLVRSEPLVDSLEGEAFCGNETEAGVSFTGDARAAISVHFDVHMKGARMWKNLWAHPKTTIAGGLLALTTIAGVLTQQGITLGHAGTGTYVGLASAIGTALLGLVSRDPGGS
jgi:hypothetical protein